MQIGLVIGTATATVKHPTLTGWKLLIVQPLMANGRNPDGDPQLAIDKFGAGRGEHVIITSDGKGTQELMNAKNCAGSLECDGNCGSEIGSQGSGASPVALGGSRGLLSKSTMSSDEQLEQIVHAVLAQLRSAPPAARVRPGEWPLRRRMTAI